MALIITEKEGHIFLEGNINSVTSRFLKRHIEHIEASRQGLTSNISKQNNKMEIQF